MRAMSRLSGGSSDRVLRTFYVQAVRACVDYGTPCLMTMPPPLLRSLDTAQHTSLRLVLGAPMWTKCICLRYEARVCTVSTRVAQLAVGHLTTFLRPPGAAPLRASVRQALLQDPHLFRRRTWASIAAGLLRQHHQAETLLSAPDAPHPAYVAPPPWAPVPFRHTVSPLPAKKSLLTPLRLHREASCREAAAATGQPATYYTDGSVCSLTGTVGAAFVTAGSTGLFRLPDRSSSTQAELVGICQALRHATQCGRDAVLIHCDSVAAIQAICGDPLRDNISLLTGIHVLLHALQAAGRGVTLNWLPSHAGIRGNDAADRAAYEATLLPAVTFPLPPSVSSAKRRAVTHAFAQMEVELDQAFAAGSPSAHWYVTATASHTRAVPPKLPRAVTVPLHRLRLDYKCTTLLDPDNPVEVACPHCEDDVTHPLLHYLLECRSTAPFLPRTAGLSALEIIADMSDEALIRLVTSHAPPR